MIDQVSAAFALKLAAGALVLAFLAAERLRPAGPWQGGAPRIGRNLALWLGNSALALAVVVPLTAWAAGHGLGWRPTWWAGVPGFALDLLLLDLWLYAWHRANHRLPLLWRFHEIHHRDAMLDVTTAVRFHPGEILLSALVRAPLMILLAMPLASIVAFEALVLAATAFHHSNLALPPRLERALSRLVVTPSIHWVHHHARRRDTDSNYATVLSLWDRLFASRSPTARSPAMALGDEGEAALGLGRLVMLPFRRPGAAGRASAGGA